VLLYYFIAQAFGSILVFGGSLIGESSGYFLESPILCFLGLIVKLGLSPTHSWYLYLLKIISVESGFVLITWQKLSPLVASLWVLNSNKFYLICVSLGLTLLFFSQQTKLLDLFSYSRILSTSWILTLVHSTLTHFCIYFLVTSFLIYPLWSSLVNRELQGVFYFNGGWVFILSLLFFLGFPPFIGFTIKLILISKVSPVSLSLAIFYLLTAFVQRIRFTSTLTVTLNFLTNHLNQETGNELTLATIFILVTIVFSSFTVLIFFISFKNIGLWVQRCSEWE